MESISKRILKTAGNGSVGKEIFSCEAVVCEEAQVAIR